MPPTRPTDLFDREQEWADLAGFVSDPTPGLRLGVVYGRRRQGKSFLLRRLAAATGGFYYQALEHEPAQALVDLGERLGAHVGVGRLAFADWDEALSSIRRLAGALGGGGAGPSVAILDEFPYLLERAPHLLSLLQRAVDRSSEEGGPAVRLILCGSAISVMAGLLHGQSPLRGRVFTNVLMRPFDHLDSRRFWTLDDPGLALRVHAILGGTPGYRDLVRSVPASPEQFDSWVVNEVLSPASALFHEDEWLLGEERGIENRAIYQSVLTAIAGGRSTEAAIARQLRRSQQSVQHPLRALVES
ncbi:MAG: ATP-binding protein, partial [Candidatus Dormibacteraeota bacterium]|nr:ATP-binding protein [Candidatus Dormibacteraeota bacterium]